MIFYRLNENNDKITTKLVVIDGESIHGYCCVLLSFPQEKSDRKYETRKSWKEINEEFYEHSELLETHPELFV